MMQGSRASGMATFIAGPRNRSIMPAVVHGRVPAVFWPLAAIVLAAGCAIALGFLPAGSSWIGVAAIAVMLLGGLPHGACDLSLAAAAMRCDRRQLGPLILLYWLVGAAMAALWWLSPLTALLVFLGLAGVHFGEDWSMLPPGLLRAMAGMAVITVAAFGQQTQVAALFVGLTGSPDAVMVARWAQAAAPLTVLVTLVGLENAWRLGYRRWVAAYCACLLGLLLLPPLLGFTLFFVGLHAPKHWHGLQQTLPRVHAMAAGREGIWITALTLAVWLIGMRWLGPVSSTDTGLGAEAFRLLSIVAAPHFALSLALEKRVNLLRSAQ